MHVTGYNNKYEIFQEFYYVVKGIELTYNKAVEMFYQMDNATRNEFCNFYKDKVDYVIEWQYKKTKNNSNGNTVGDEIIYDTDGSAIIINPPYTNVTGGYGIRPFSGLTLEEEKNPDGSVKKKKKKIKTKDADGNWGWNGETKEVTVYKSEYAKPI